MDHGIRVYVRPEVFEAAARFREEQHRRFQHQELPGDTRNRTSAEGPAAVPATDGVIPDAPQP